MSALVIVGFFFICLVSLAAGFVGCAFFVSGRILDLENGLRLFADKHNWIIVQEGTTVYHAWNRGDSVPPCMLAARIVERLK